MEFNFAPSGRMKEFQFILSNANHRRLCYLNNVIKASFSGVFLSVSEIKIEVTKYIWNQDTQELVLSNGYDSIDVLMEVEVPGIGWFRIDEPPSINATSSKTEIKSFTLKSYETQLSDADLKSFVVNKGTIESLEMYDGNLNALKIPQETISLYNDKNPKLSLLDLALEETPNWSVGYIDESIRGLKRSFEIDSEDILSFLMNDAAQSYRCIFTFDTYNHKVNAYDIETFGADTGIFFNYRNLIDTLNIEPYTKAIYTKFEVAGGDGLEIAGYNFNSNYITNIDYFMDTRRFKQETINKYTSYKNALGGLRTQFNDKFKLQVRANEKKKELENRAPDNSVENTWAKYDDKELGETLNAYKNMVETLRQMYTHNGVFDIEGYADYSLYYTYKDVIIPDIEAEIVRRATLQKEYTPVDYKKMYNLWGSVGLQTLKTQTENSISSLVELGYDKEYSEALSISKDTFDTHHKEWLDAKAELVKIDAAIAQRKSEIVILDSEIKTIIEQCSSIAAQSDIGHADYGFSKEELVAIQMHYLSTDFKDENIVVSKYDDAVSKLAVQKELFNSAIDELDIESHPQLDFSINSQNIYAIPEFARLRTLIQLGSFMHVEVNGFLTMKLRVSEINLNLLEPDKDFGISFTSQTLSKGKYNDLNSLIESAISSSRNSITKETNNYVNSNISALSGAITASIIKPYLEITNANIQNAVIGSVTAQDLTAVIGRFNTIVSNYIKTNELEAAIANIKKLNADSAFIKYLEGEFAKFTNIDIKDLTAKLAQIDKLIAGTVSVGLGHIINLTAENVTISDAVIMDLIAKKITVGDLLSGSISTNMFNILSDDGGLSIVGNTMQFKDSNNVVRIQIGRDARNNFTFCLYNETGKGILIDSTGIKDSAIADGTIKNNMIADSTIGKEKFNFNVMETKPDGTIDAGKVTVGGNGIDVEFTTIKEIIKKNEIYTIYINKPNGTAISNGRSLVFSARLFKNSIDITDQYTDDCFIWTRQSYDNYDDIYWNSNHSSGSKNLTITKNDVNRGCNFTCTFTVNGKNVTSSLA